jgi:hypothetical protein
MTKKVAIVQSCYIPWKGYFDLINSVDEFILYDDMQYTRRDWRNRNMIKTPNGAQWLTIPVEVKGKYFQKINETKFSENDWMQKHWKTIAFNYAKTSYFKQFEEEIASLYIQCEQEEFLSQVNYLFLIKICSLLGIRTRLTWSTDYEIDPELKKTDRLLALCQQAGATHYISGPAAQSYMQTDLFEKTNIKLSYIDYSGYPEYPQMFGDFTHTVSILDLLFNVGNDAYKYMKSFHLREKIL